MIYATLENKTNALIFNCGANYVANFTTFGWKFGGDNNKGNISGLYELKLYWNTPTTKQTIGTDNNQYKLITDGIVMVDIIIYNEKDTKYEAIMSVKDVDDTQKPFELNKGDTKKFEFTSSVAMGSKVSVYYEQCANSTFECIKYYPNDDGLPFVFYYDGMNENEIINLPNNNSLKQDLSINDNKLMTYMIMEVGLCGEDGKVISRQNITINGSGGGGNDRLTAGAVIGIICAGVLVIALGGWWLFMRNSSGDGYRTLDE